VKKFPIELNGVANIKILLDNPLTCPIVQKQALMEQLDLLERYMLALSDAAALGAEPPYWHEIRQLKESFPTLSERRNLKLKPME